MDQERKCEVHLLEVNEPSSNSNDAEKDRTKSPSPHAISPFSPADAEVTLDLCAVVPKQTETPEDPNVISHTSSHRHTNQKKHTSVMYLIPIEATKRGYRTSGRRCNAVPQAVSEVKSRKTILRTHSTPAPTDRVERIVNVKETSPSSAKVSFVPDVKASSQSLETQSEGKVLVINDKGRTIGQDQTHASMQLLMRYTKELEGKRLRNERLRQKNSLHFGYQAIQWMAISHSVMFVCASVVILVLVKG
ncbi:hypothetical protein QFC21_000907 [Naganishia friedmannii]|uniref:Uncharacterized protein n=1 Tax=Naganishia friedmannii TaxID=89922 RepID=A0ACC2W6T7_9TREE|nr:hypothetical protein QFC21_000907 [Naganishia friedmannii]